MTMTKKNKPIRRRAIAWYGWMPDLPDQRDYLYAAPLQKLGLLPPRVDMRGQCPPVYSQGAIGSCTANAIAGAIEFDLLKQELAGFVPSRLFIYYNERVMEHSVASDNGAQLRDGVKSVNQLGVCPESQWPYVATPANPKTNVWPVRCEARAKAARGLLPRGVEPPGVELSAGQPRSRANERLPGGRLPVCFRLHGL